MYARDVKNVDRGATSPDRRRRVYDKRERARGVNAGTDTSGSSPSGRLSRAQSAVTFVTRIPETHLLRGYEPWGNESSDAIVGGDALLLYIRYYIEPIVKFLSRFCNWNDALNVKNIAFKYETSALIIAIIPRIREIQIFRDLHARAWLTRKWKTRS